jgi:hypothetical protein
MLNLLNLAKKKKGKQYRTTAKTYTFGTFLCAKSQCNHRNKLRKKKKIRNLQIKWHWIFLAKVYFSHDMAFILGTHTRDEHTNPTHL